MLSRFEYVPVGQATQVPLSVSRWPAGHCSFVQVALPGAAFWPLGQGVQLVLPLCEACVSAAQGVQVPLPGEADAAFFERSLSGVEGHKGLSQF